MTDYLDLMPKDVLDMINKQVKDDYIIERRLERKENRRQNRKDKINADRRKESFERFVNLYREYLLKKYMNKIENYKEDYSIVQYEFLEKHINKVFRLKGNYEYQYNMINLVLEGEFGLGGGN